VLALMGDTFQMSVVSYLSAPLRTGTLIYIVAVVSFAAYRKRDGAVVYALGMVVFAFAVIAATMALDRRSDSLRHDFPMTGFRLWQEGGKLLASVTRDQVALSHIFPHYFRNVTQDQIARRMPERVIVKLKVIYVEH